MIRKNKGINFDNNIEELSTNQKLYSEDNLDELYLQEERKRDENEIKEILF